jgi:purine-binding chemotaxis protein CheW
MSHADALNAYLDGLLGDAPVAAETPAPPATAPRPVAAPRAAPAPPAASVAPPQPIAPQPAPTAPPPRAVAAPSPARPMLSPEIARLFAPPPAVVESGALPPVRWLCFLLSGQAYAVEVQKVQEVVRVPDIAPVAGAGGDTIGVMNLRGQIVQVISLRQRLGFGAAAPSAEQRVVVLEEDGLILGLLVDAVAEVFAAAADAMNETGLVHGALPADWFRGLLRRGPDLVVALDASRLLAH